MYFITGKQSCITKEKMERCEKRSFYSVYQGLLQVGWKKAQKFRKKFWSEKLHPDGKITVFWNFWSIFSDFLKRSKIRFWENFFEKPIFQNYFTKV